MAPLNGSIAPVCPISRDQPVAGQTGIMLPFIPRAVDLPTAIIAANQINRLVQTALSPPPPHNNFTPPGPSGGAPDGGSGRPVEKKPDRWKEKKRTTNIIRFYPKDENGKEDKDQWVEVERIVYIKWHDTVQKIDLIFEWPYDPGLEGGKLMKSSSSGT